MTAEMQSNILPFIREGNAKCNFAGSFSSIEISVDGDKKEQLIKYIEGNQNGGWYHFGCPVSEFAEIRFDDGEIKIYFKFSGKTSEVKDKFLKEVKALGIKIDFTEYKAQLMLDLKRVQGKIDDVTLLESELS